MRIKIWDMYTSGRKKNHANLMFSSQVMAVAGLQLRRLRRAADQGYLTPTDSQMEVDTKVTEESVGYQQNRSCQPVSTGHSKDSLSADPMWCSRKCPSATG